jgi:hypothetical protein
MSDLKIKVSLGSFNVELEGASQDVISQFEEIKKNGLGQMVEQLIPVFTQNQINPVEQSLPGTIVERESNMSSSRLLSEDISLKNVVIKMLPQTEPEWILTYCYYINNEGKTSFTRPDILKKYEESNRKSKSRVKNLSASIIGSVRKNWISALNDTEYMITEQGIIQAKQILNRTEGTAKPPKSKNKKDKHGTESTISK